MTTWPPSSSRSSSTRVRPSVHGRAVRGRRREARLLRARPLRCADGRRALRRAARDRHVPPHRGPDLRRDGHRHQSEGPLPSGSPSAAELRRSAAPLPVGGGDRRRRRAARASPRSRGWCGARRPPPTSGSRWARPAPTTRECAARRPARARRRCSTARPMVVVGAASAACLAELVTRRDARAGRGRRGGGGTGMAVAAVLPEPAGDAGHPLRRVARRTPCYVPLNPRATAGEPRVCSRWCPAVLVRVRHAACARRGRHRAHEPRPATATTRRGPRAAHVGHDGRAEAGPAQHSTVLALMDGVLASSVGAAPTPSRSPQPNLIPVSLSLWAGIYNVLFAFRVGAPVVLMEAFSTDGARRRSCAGSTSARWCCRRRR